MTRVAVLDVGKTNAKLALVDGATLAEIAVLTRPNGVLPGPPWPHMDLEGHWRFFLDGLRLLQEAHGIDAISVTTHGAAAVLLDGQGDLAAPMLDYEHAIPSDPAYDALRPDFGESGSPRLQGGLNLGAQLHWLMDQPGVAQRAAHVVTYPQYWGHRLTGRLASDVTSLGCHTDLWDPWQGRFSSLVGGLGLGGRIAPARRADEVLGGVTAEVEALTGIPTGTPVAVGIHDSNASLYPHLLGQRGPFAVVSTGTWVVCMAVDAAPVALDPARDVLVNVNALGRPVPSARFMGGREYEVIRHGCDAAPTAADRAAVLRDGVMLLPAVQGGCGPFPDRVSGWTSAPANDGQRMTALAWYLALMTRTCLDLTGACGPVIVEGPFARNPDYLDMLAALTPEAVAVAASATGTSTGAALLCLPDARPPAARPWTPRSESGLDDYARRWRAACQA